MVASPPLPNFAQTLGQSLTKGAISVLQINLGRRCNLACNHCHVEASPQRREELSPEVCGQLCELMRRFPQIQTVDLTGGAPEMNYGFRDLVATARAMGKTVIVRSNLTIFEVAGFTDLPDYFAAQGVRVVASLPCYLEDNVDRQRGVGVYQGAIRGLQRLNQLGYGQRGTGLILDLVYNPSVPHQLPFALTPSQGVLEGDYRQFLGDHFGIVFNQLLTITNLPIGRTRQLLERQGLYGDYVHFLAAHHNPNTLPHLMCRHQLSVDYLGHLYDCDFNQMADLKAQDRQGNPLTVADLLVRGDLDQIGAIQTAPFCFGCTAGSGSSCGGALT